jgi:hypothetical protein
MTDKHQEDVLIGFIERRDRTPERDRLTPRMEAHQMLQALAYEPPEPDDEAHAINRRLGLTVAGCPCRRCANLRDIATVAGSRFGDEDPEALAAMDRMNRRVDPR